jgi:AraC family transcriptional activator of pyochelin receptor
MTIILTSADYEQLWEESSAKGNVTLIENDWSYAETWQHSFAKRFLQILQLRFGLSVEIGNSESFCTWGLEIEHPNSYPLTLAFQILGKARALTPEVNNDYYYESAGENYLFSVAGANEIEEKLAGEQLLSVRIRIEPEFLRTFSLGQLDLLPKEVHPFLNGNNLPVFHRCVGESTPEMQLALRQILNCSYQGVMKQMFIESKVLELITLQFTQLIEMEKGKKLAIRLRPQDIDSIHYAKEILINNLDNPPSLLELARQVGVSERKLKQGFRSCFGTTAFKYLHHYRMARSRQLLAEGRMSVAEVANSVGYSHLSHFASAFKRQFGVNPGSYLRSSVGVNGG